MSEDRSAGEGEPVSREGRDDGAEGSIPVIADRRCGGVQRVFVEHVSFEERFRSDWRVSLVPGENEAYDLAFIAHEHETIPENDRRPTSARLLNFEVPGVQHAFDGLRA